MIIVRLAAAAMAVMCLTACATAPPRIGATFRATNPSATILLMEPDVDVYFITTGGTERRVEWSDQAEANLVTALRAQLERSGERVIAYDPAEHQSAESQQALLLNQAVTSALAAHVVFMDIATFAGVLPHQASQPETYTLAESIQQLAPGTEADYALFLTSNSRIESGGVFWTSVMIGAVTGYTPVAATFRGTYVSLVDLHTGEVLWLRGWNAGDPRSATEATTIIANIFKDNPLAPAPQP